MLKYTNYAIVFQEVPNEVSLVFNISGCAHHCHGCHSEYLWEDVGEPLVENVQRIVDEYRSFITCVCFMGGDHNIDELMAALYIVKHMGLKTCIYSGEDTIEKFTGGIGEYIDYLKIGHYDSDAGPLNVETTNQIFYRVDNDINGSFKDKLEDITSVFWKKAID